LRRNALDLVLLKSLAVFVKKFFSLSVLIRIYPTSAPMPEIKQ
jgi:hypothetical protein